MQAENSPKDLQSFALFKLYPQDKLTNATIRKIPISKTPTLNSTPKPPTLETRKICWYAP